VGRAIPDPRPAGGPLPKGNHGRKPPMPKTNLHGRRPPPPKKNADACCPMVAAARSARAGRYRLARRYAVMSVRLIAARAL
jgi:hypothetical protein